MEIILEKGKILMIAYQSVGFAPSVRAREDDFSSSSARNSDDADCS